MRAAAYVRVSSLAQDAAGQRHAVERATQARVERATQARGDEVARWYSERRSAKTMAHLELNRRRATAGAEILRRLYTYRPDRLTRFGIRDTLKVIDEVRSHDCDTVSVADGFDLNGPGAEVVLAVLSWADQVERLAINEPISAASCVPRATLARAAKPGAMASSPSQEAL